MPDPIPKFYDFFNPVLQAVAKRGGSATIDEIVEGAVEMLGLPSEVTEVPHGDTNQTEVGYRIAWARSYLKKDGLLDNSRRGVWTLTEKGRQKGVIDPDKLKRRVRALKKAQPPDTKAKNPPEATAPQQDEEEAERWKVDALTVLKEMDPIAFERLCQRLLREAGFIEVEVTKRSGDGGIDGRGILRLNGLISFTVMFQSKRYKDTVSSPVVRDFRGALMGRADKGLIITTGRFTIDAKKEATRDGATPIDLIDGEMLVEKLKELELGIRTRIKEVVEVDTAWFDSI
jgi:restriction system protein